MRTGLSRRVVLRGLFRGATVAVALPFLDCFLNSNGTALAAGAPLPVRFGTWFWGLGVTPGRWHPTKVGRDYDLLPELTPIAAQQDKVTIFSGFNCLTDGRPNFPHATAGPAFRTGIAPSAGGAFHGPSFDSIIASEIGNDTRFRSLELSAVGDRRNTLSGQGVGQMNPTETSALRFYQRIFGEGFTDPNAATFTPDPIKIARKSALSVVTEQRRALEKQLGAADRARVDQYFTSLRQVESQLALQLQKPEPLVACKVPASPEDKDVANDLEDVTQSHEVMTRLLAMALACNQTKVFNMNFNNGSSTLTRRGSSTTHHQLTHDEPVDAALGYQPESTKFIEDIATALLQSLKSHALNPERIYSHSHAIGDIAIIDQFQTLHSAIPIDLATGEDDARLLWRIGLKGAPGVLKNQWRMEAAV